MDLLSDREVILYCNYFNNLYIENRFIGFLGVFEKFSINLEGPKRKCTFTWTKNKC